MNDAQITDRPRHLYDAYILDLDGTVYLGDALLPGAQEVVTELMSRDIPRLYLSNNPTRDREMYVRKLNDLGIPARPEEVITTVFTTTQWLLQNAPDATVFPIAEEPLIRALHAAGIRISEDPREIDIVIASYDREVHWKKLQIAFEAIWYYKRAYLIATNPDMFCPFPGGRGEVDAGAIIAALEATTGTKLRVNCGKPSPVMLRTIGQALGIELERSLIVGDRLYTEIRMGIEAGVDTALVLTGETDLPMLSETAGRFHPTYVLPSIAEILPSP
ncbi:MAG: HAD-IIA family hydrolase [Spirochaeta sp.]|jgi:HAD superfamily hydrolase (TIGR01450 family)|nr:HAD-IIA family hydrolase [Spirochaeta sp.]